MWSRRESESSGGGVWGAAAVGEPGGGRAGGRERADPRVLPLRHSPLPLPAPGPPPRLQHTSTLFGREREREREAETRTGKADGGAEWCGGRGGEWCVVGEVRRGLTRADVRGAQAGFMRPPQPANLPAEDPA
eukprot:1529022-Rhodomonas_salina.1